MWEEWETRDDKNVIFHHKNLSSCVDGDVDFNRLLIEVSTSFKHQSRFFIMPCMKFSSTPKSHSRMG
jgi:hypothetical protein